MLNYAKMLSVNFAGCSKRKKLSSEGFPTLESLNN